MAFRDARRHEEREDSHRRAESTSAERGSHSEARPAETRSAKQKPRPMQRKSQFRIRVPGIILFVCRSVQWSLFLVPPLPRSAELNCGSLLPSIIDRLKLTHILCDVLRNRSHHRILHALHFDHFIQFQHAIFVAIVV